MKIVALGALLVGGAPVFACMGVSPNNAPVIFRGQTDIVVWDEQLHVEHFIRNARFDAKEDVAFLAPTPTVPKIAAVGPEGFEQLSRLTVPPTRSSGEGGGGFGGQGGGQPSAPTSVVVVEMMDVGSYTAAILQASDTGDLHRWLDENEFPTPEWMETWAAPYLRKGWTITAFKLQKGKTKATGPVRMTFSTERPFAPYAVPKQNGGSGSKLRLFLVSESPLRGVVGGENWGAKEIGRTVLSDSQTATLAKNIGVRPFDMPGRPIVRAFDDAAFGTEPIHDLFFVSAPTPGEDDPGSSERHAWAWGLLAPGTLLISKRSRRA